MHQLIQPSLVQISLLASKSATGEVLGEQSKNFRGVVSKILEDESNISWAEIEKHLSKLPETTRLAIVRRQKRKVCEIEVFWTQRKRSNRSTFVM